MKTSGSTRQLTVRLGPTLYRRATQLAKARSTTVNGLVRDLLMQLDREEADRELRRAYALAGAEPLDDDVSAAFDAQSEVARGR